MRNPDRPQLTRRQFVSAAAMAAGAWTTRPAAAQESKTTHADDRVPVIDITDLYHPPQDPGDNFDLIAAYGLPEIDLRAVVLDVTGRYRRPYRTPDGKYSDPRGKRDAGFVPVTQLNSIFGRAVPCAPGPYDAMRSPDDRMDDAPAFQQTGISLLLDTLRDCPEPVDIVSFGSARPLAVAYNREPSLMRDKTRLVHLCAGAAPDGYLEWNVQLDVHAFVRALTCDLPVAVYPCATEKGPFDLGPHNCFWKLPDMQFVRDMAPALQRYCAFAFERTVRMDFLCALEDDVAPDVLNKICGRAHSVWETSVWAQVSGRRIVRRGDGPFRLVPVGEVRPDDTVLPNDLWSCRLDVRDDGQFTFKRTDAPSADKFIYYRGDPVANQAALREALPALYTSFLREG